MLAMFMVVALSACVDTGGSPSATALSPEAQSLVARLRSSGLAVEASGEIEQPFFSVKGQVLAIGREQIQVFTFPNSDAAAMAERPR